MTSRELSIIERLILAQAVWELGANEWSGVAKILSKHPLLSRPKSFFTAQSCHHIYDTLMDEAGIERTEANNVVHAPLNLKLAQKHYQARVVELRDLIAAEESMFKIIVAEIEDIRSGAWDDKLKFKATEMPLTPEEGHKDSIPEIIPTEAFDESDLSGVTDSGSPSYVRGSAPRPNNLEKDGSIRDTEEIQKNISESTPCEPIQSQPSSPKSPNIARRMSIDVTIPERGDTEPITEQQYVQIEGDIPLDATTTTLVPVATSDSANQVDVGVVSFEDEKTREADKITEVPTIITNDSEAQQSPQREAPHDSGLKLDSVSNTVQEPEPVTELGHTLTPPNIQELEPESEDEDLTSGDEPLHMTRQSTRRRRSSVLSTQPSQPRGNKTRRQRRTSREEEPAAEDDTPLIETKGEGVDTPMAEDDQVPSSTGPDANATRRQEGKRKASFADEPLRDKKRHRDDSEPAEEDDSGPNYNNTRTRRRDRPERQAVDKRFQYVIGMLHASISQHRNGTIFHNPIKKSEAADYHDIVKYPLDLKTIKARVKDGAITTSLEYQRDICLMFTNAMMYNRPGTDIYAMAEDMMLESEAHINAFRQTEGLVRGVHRS